MKALVSSILRLGTGEAVSRLASFGLYAYISRTFGVELLGIVALSQTIAMYVMFGTDQGLRMIGARLVARDASAARVVMRHVLRKRLLSCAICVALGSVYALWGPVPANARFYVLGFVLAVIPYAFSLDWLAWGLDHFGWLGAWRGGVGLFFVLGAIAAIRLSGTTLLPITIANAASTVLGAILLWALWRFRWQTPHSESEHGNNEIDNQFRWAAVLPLGGATILNLMFNNFDSVMLGAMTSAREVGRYSAAYKILFVIFGAYYLLTQSLYPKLSRMKGGRQARRLLSFALIVCIAFGACVAVVIAIWAVPILRTIYGGDLNAVRLVRILSLAVPMEFCVALMGTVLVSRGFHKLVLACTASAATFDLVSNWFLIPRLRAEGAAWSTVASYLLLLILVLTAVFAAKPVLQEELASPTASACPA
jgi:O-antigen/teichoic acid export membrane protein